MNAIFEDLLNNIPEYKEFLTLAELDESSRRLAEKHPDSVELFTMGTTREGRPLLCLKIAAPDAADGTPDGQYPGLQRGCILFYDLA